MICLFFSLTLTSILAHLPFVSGTTKKTKIVPHRAMNPITNPSLAPRFKPGVRIRYGTMRMKTNRMIMSTQVQKLMTVEVSRHVLLGMTHTSSSFDYHRPRMRIDLMSSALTPNIWRKTLTSSHLERYLRPGKKQHDRSHHDAFLSTSIRTLRANRSNDNITNDQHQSSGDDDGSTT